MTDNLKLTSSVETITPEMAGEYLKNNSMNRPIHKKDLANYEHLMRSGKWVFDPSASIVFAEDGTLLQGQHRLQAAVNTGTTLISFVVHGADKHSFVAMDTGAKRTGSDILGLKGYPNHTKIAAIITFYIALCKGNALQREEGKPEGRNRLYITNGDILSEYESNPEFYQAVCSLAIRHYKNLRLFTESQYGGVCAYLVRRKLHDITRVDEFYQELNDGSTHLYLKELRRKIINARIVKNAKLKLTGRAKLTMLSKAWNYFVSGEDRKTIAYRPTDKMIFD